MNKEQAYDSEINPLMAEIIRICGEHKIAFVASFALGPNPEEEDEELLCTSAGLSDDRSPPDVFVEALQVMSSSRFRHSTRTKCPGKCGRILATMAVCPECATRGVKWN